VTRTTRSPTTPRRKRKRANFQGQNGTKEVGSDMEEGEHHRTTGESRPKIIGVGYDLQTKKKPKARETLP